VQRSITIASWNINSVRARLPIVERLLNEHEPDILCLQETKAANDAFPADFFRRLG
jgi:exodeoxyribonuclease-3